MLSQCVDWWEIFLIFILTWGENLEKVWILAVPTLLYLYHCCWATLERKDEENKKGECTLCTGSTGTLQPSCSGDYYLWKSLHVVRTWAVSLSSSGADGERALFSVPVAALTHLSQFLYQFLFIVLTVYKSKSSAGWIPSFPLFLFFFSFFF